MRNCPDNEYRPYPVLHERYATARELEWLSVAALATDRFMLYEMGKMLFWTALIILSGGTIVALFLGGASEPLEDWLFILGIFAAILAGFALLFLLIMLVFFGNRYSARITINRHGVAWEGVSRRGKWANRAAVVAGALGGNPTVAGAGLLAESSREVAMAWGDIRRVRCHPRHCTISLMNGWRVVLRLHCHPTNYEQACRLIQSFAPHAQVEGGLP